MLQPVHLVCIDDRTSNLSVLARNTENLEFQITLNIITTVDDPDFDAKIQAAVLQQMQAADNNGEAAV